MRFLFLGWGVGWGGVGWGLIIVTQVQLWCFELALREKYLMFESVTTPIPYLNSM